MSKLTPGPKTNKTPEKSQRCHPWMTNEHTHIQSKIREEEKGKEERKKRKQQKQDRFRNYCRCFRDAQRMVR